jgi:hypothetical protein
VALRWYPPPTRHLAAVAVDAIAAPTPEIHVATQPDELDDELDPDLVGEVLDDDDLEEEDDLADGFVVEGEDVEVSDETDEGSTVLPVAELAAEDLEDDFADEPVLVAVTASEDEEEDIPVRRSGEFICQRCYLVKSNSQLANRKQKICRDCA